MPLPHLRMLNQDALLWEATTQVDEYGRVKVLAPVELKCKWEDSSEEVVDTDGRRINLNASVIVNQAVPEASIMYEGTQDQYDEAVTNGADINYMEVKTISTVPELRNRGTPARTLGLIRYRNTLPTITP